MATKEKQAARPLGGRKYTVEAQVTSWCSVDVIAASFEAALAVAQRLVSSDFVDVKGKFIDSSMELVTVRDNAALTI